MRHFFIIIVLVLLLPQGVTAAPAGDLSAFLARLERRVAQISDFSCDFRQKRHLKLFSRPVVFFGKLTVARPRRLSWATTAPLASRLVINQERGFRCVDGQAHDFDLSADPVMAAVSRQMWSFLSGSFASLPAGWVIEMAGPDTVAITPAAGGLFARIVVSFDPKELRPRRVRLFQGNGDETVITFSRYRAGEAEDFKGCGEGM